MIDPILQELRENLLYYISKKICYPLIAPEMLQIMMTNACNLQCKMCGVWKQQVAPESLMATEEVKRVIDEACALGVKMIYFTGGEALLRPDIFDLIAHTARAGVVSTLNTNGSLITPELAEKIVVSGLQSLTFSIDSPDEHIHDAIR